VGFLFSFFLALATAFESAKKRIMQVSAKAREKRKRFNAQLGVNDIKPESTEDSKKQGLQKKLGDLRVRMLATLTAVVTFFEMLPLFITVIIWAMVILCIVVLVIVILSMLAVVPQTINDKPIDAPRDDSTGSVTACTIGDLAWTDDDLKTRGLLLTPYEKNIYIMGILAKQTIEGYGVKELGAEAGVAKNLRVLMLLGKASIESSMTFYENKSSTDDIRVRNTVAGVNSSGYGFMGICGNNDQSLSKACYPAKTIDSYYPDAETAKKIKEAYTPSSKPVYPGQFAPWGVAMSGRHFMNNLNEVESTGWLPLIDKVAAEWGIVAKKEEFADLSALFLAQVRYHSGNVYNSNINEVESYINFYAALFSATSDKDSERSFSKWSISADPDLSYGESEIRRMIVGSKGMDGLANVSTPDDLDFSSGSTPILLNGVPITKPLWSVLWDKFKDKNGMKLAWSGVQHFSALSGGLGDRVLNYHYGLNSYLQANKVVNVLSTKMVGEAVCVDSTDKSILGEQIVKSSLKWIGMPYKEANPVISIRVPGNYINGVNIKGTFIGTLDCSSFTRVVFKAFGYALPRRAVEQYAYEGQDLVSETIDLSKMKPGDIIYFWGTSDATEPIFNSYKEPTQAPREVKEKNVSHVGIYFGGGKMIHASYSDNSIMVANLSLVYWTKYTAGVKRIKY
jgi:cell wall-associated NlpC family hydrolase